VPGGGGREGGRRAAEGLPLQQQWLQDGNSLGHSGSGQATLKQCLHSGRRQGGGTTRLCTHTYTRYTPPSPPSNTGTPCNQAAPAPQTRDKQPQSNTRGIVFACACSDVRGKGTALCKDASPSPGGAIASSPPASPSIANSKPASESAGSSDWVVDSGTSGSRPGEPHTQHINMQQKKTVRH
jgi:hypothetical protein